MSLQFEQGGSEACCIAAVVLKELVYLGFDVSCFRLHKGFNRGSRVLGVMWRPV